MKREQLSQIISNIDERLVDEASHFDPDRSGDSSERIAHMKKIKILALVAVLTIALGAVAYAAYDMWLQDLLVESSDTDIAIVEEITADAEAAETTDDVYSYEEPNNYISLQGFSDSPEYRAMLAWREFEKNYDPDGQILEQAGDGATLWDEKYNSNGYNPIYSQEMADKIDEIAAEYGLSLHTGRKGAESMAEIYEKFGGFCPAEEYGGYYFDDGSFQCSCTFNELEFSIRRCMKGVLDIVGLGLGNIDQYEQWEYQTSCGITVLIAMGPGNSLIIANLENSFVTVNIAYPVDINRQDIETLADAIDFSIL